MKRFLSLTLCSLLLFALTSCQKEAEKKEDKMTTSRRNVVVTRDEVGKLASVGKFNKAHFALGEKLDKISNYFQNEIQKETSTGESTEIAPNGMEYDFYEGNRLNVVYFATNMYYFFKDNTQAGAVVITENYDSYGFISGKTTTDDLVHSLGEPDYKDNPDQNEIFYILGGFEKAERYTYYFNNKRLDFIFINDLLSISAISDTGVYKEFSGGLQNPSETIGE